MPNSSRTWRFVAALGAVPAIVWMAATWAPARGQAGEADYARVNAAIADGHVIPRYERFDAAAAAFEESTRAFCGGAAPRHLAPVRAAYHAAMDAWMGIEHIRMGPIGAKNRRYRIEFWPDRNGLAAKHLKLLLATPDESLATPDRLASARVSIQGFPAVEFMLFDTGAAERLVSANPGDYACRLLTAITGNLARIAQHLSAEWRGGAKPFAGEIRSPGPEGAIFDKHRSVTADFVEALHFALQGVAHLKVARPLGDSVDRARPRRCESWRSRRSLRNVVVNLEALRALYEGEAGDGLKTLMTEDQRELADLLSKAFRQTMATARSVDRPFSEALTDPTVRPTLERLATQLRALSQLIGDRLGIALGTPLGFNEKDGD